MKRKRKYSTNDPLKMRAFKVINNICKIWNSQKRPPKVRYMGKRLHHYYYALVGLALSTIFQSSNHEQDKKLGRYIEGGSMALLLDDYVDFERDFKKFLKNMLKF